MLSNVLLKLAGRQNVLASSRQFSVSLRARNEAAAAVTQDPEIQAEAPAPPARAPRVRGECLLKVLIPSNVTGLIIGKGGANIIRLREESQFETLSLSRAGDEYPSTTERIFLMDGTREAISKGLKMVVDACSMQSNNSFDYPMRDQYDLGNWSRHNEVKMVVPRPLVGAIMGQGGATIRPIAEETGSQVGVEKLPPLQLQHTAGPEAIITVANKDPEMLAHAVNKIVDIMQERPETRCYIMRYSELAKRLNALVPAAPAPGFAPPPPAAAGGAQPALDARAAQEISAAVAILNKYGLIQIPRQ